jgi:hypothetical protein
MHSWSLKQAPILLCLATMTPQRVVAPTPMNAVEEAQLARDIPALMQKDGIPGLSIAVIQAKPCGWGVSA